MNSALPEVYFISYTIHKYYPIFYTLIYVSGILLGMDLITDTQRTYILKEIGLCTQSMLNIMGSIVNMIRGTYMTTW